MYTYYAGFDNMTISEIEKTETDQYTVTVPVCEGGDGNNDLKEEIIVSIISPVRYELTDADYARIDELLTTSGKMPRKSGNRRVELLLSPEQYEALLKEAEAGGYITILPELDTETSGSVAEFLRDHLAWTIASFGKAKPLAARGRRGGV
jgi:hypothetical protein